MCVVVVAFPPSLPLPHLHTSSLPWLPTCTALFGLDEESFVVNLGMLGSCTLLVLVIFYLYRR